MRIEHVSVNAYRIPPNPPWEDATNKVGGIEFIVVELKTDTGLTGTGFSYTVDVGGTAIQSLIEHYLANLIIGLDPLNYEYIWQLLQRQSRRLGLGVNALAIAAIDVAVWDLIGKHHKQPLYRLLGGARESIPCYISGIDLGDTLEQLLDRVRGYREQQYRTVKIKIGKETIEEDIERIVKVQELLGAGATVLVDANQKWSAAEALQACAKLDHLNLGWIEEPILYHDIEGHRHLRRHLRTPIALGESLFSKYQFLEYLKQDAIDIVQADVAFVGGITEWVKIAHLSQAYGKVIAPHYMMELSVHLLCGVTNGYMLENVVGGSFTELGVLETPITVKNGLGVPSDRPGHGIVFDQSALDAYKLDPEAVRRTFVGGSKQ
ncbi:mandelate racemase/muconate lactonizing enzyme family protein [Paenibacillus sp. GCM10023248]|uniref:mandelate racemase/muconate lactonizing enzyme family protein n=1 Tax=unclassified Paenibacillus TaxID=185978 RepID=UPI0023793D7E|nr:mandelate racemase/muconate lactonizing enzyme family protein [Paenibacillus sp. MAHUQ-63]MDD9268216.1 mandelate racemase/muconate lactonizing enzyme family protein [Paenibacillus sp. MAHUQ-63]